MDLRTIIVNMSEKRPIFHNEADFQHALAWSIQEHYPDAKIRLEMKVHGPDKKVYLDILASIAGRKYAIELKCKTRIFEYVIDGEEFSLSNHGAQDTGRYDVLKDLQRLEQMVETKVVDEGILVFLTNDASYYEASKQEKQTADRDFRLHEGRKIHGKLSWSEHTGQGTMKGREEPLFIQGQYLSHWDLYSNVSNNMGGEFQYLLLQVRNITTREVNLAAQSTAILFGKTEAENDDDVTKEIPHVQGDGTNPWIYSFTQRQEIPLSQVDLRDRLAKHLREIGYSVSINRELGSGKIDVWAENDNEIIAIEVRNKTALLETIYEGRSINLKNQAAQDVSRYDFISDVGKLERLVSRRAEVKGYALLLTNDSTYWQPPKKQKSVDESFRIHDGRMLNGTCSWTDDAALGTISGREEPVYLTGSYELKWQPYLKIGTEKNMEFRALLVEVKTT